MFSETSILQLHDSYIAAYIGSRQQGSSLGFGEHADNVFQDSLLAKSVVV